MMPLYRGIARLLGLVLVLLLGFVAPVRADSPVTSTPFAEAYNDFEIVQKARQKGVMTLEIASHLSSASIPVDLKAAILNALGWDTEGRRNAEFYLYYLALTYRKPLDQISLNLFNADEVFALGYLTLMDDYPHPDRALPILAEGLKRRPDSFTVAVIGALARGQKAMESDWCQVWKLTEAVYGNDNLQNDMRQPAKKIILDSMVLYRDSCKGSGKKEKDKEKK